MNPVNRRKKWNRKHYLPRHISSLSIYKRQISRYPVLTQTQLDMLFIQYEKGSLTARNTILEHNQRLIISQTHRYLHNNIPIGDLIQAGNLGLIRAISKYNYRYGYAFSTYAIDWIRQSMRRLISNHSRTVRIPVNELEDWTRIRRSLPILISRLRRRPDFKEIGNYLNLSPSRVKKIMTKVRTTSSLDADVKQRKQEPSHTVLGQFIKNPEPNPEQLTIKNIARQHLYGVIKRALDTLSEEQRISFEMYYGLGKFKHHNYTYAQIGRKLHITHQGASARVRNATHRIRNNPGIKKFKKNEGL